MSEVEKHLEPIGEDELAVKKALEKADAKKVTPYNHFVESVVSRDIAVIQKVDPGKVAHIFKKDSPEGVEVNIVGDEAVVKPIGDVLELGGYKVREWHIKRPEDSAVEAERVRGEAVELLKQMVASKVLTEPDAVRLLGKVEKAEPEELLNTEEVIEETAQALEEFKQGGAENGKDK